MRVRSVASCRLLWYSPHLLCHNNSFEHYKWPFLRHVLTEIYENGQLQNCKRSCLHFWSQVLRNKADQREMRRVVNAYEGLSDDDNDDGDEDGDEGDAAASESGSEGTVPIQVNESKVTAPRTDSDDNDDKANNNNNTDDDDDDDSTKDLRSAEDADSVDDKKQKTKKRVKVRKRSASNMSADAQK